MTGCYIRQSNLFRTLGKKGRKEGREEGREEGRLEGREGGREEKN